MALFTVTRYGEQETWDDCEDREQTNLSKLLSKIEERRKTKFKDKKNDEEVAASIEDDDDVGSRDVTEAATPEERAKAVNALNAEQIASFQVLGVKEFEKKVKVKRTLPYWLQNPTPISVNLKEKKLKVKKVDFLNENLKKKLLGEGMKYLFPVQQSVIPWLLDEHKISYFWPRDLCVSAPTGSGKTLAYVLPIVQLLTDRLEREIKALIVLPVKELALQVAKVFKDFCIGTNLKVASITGSMTYQQEVSQLLKYTYSSGWRSEVDIVVCTAGRLVEHLQTTEGFDLRHLQFLVIDEADKIMQNIQNDWLYHLNRHTDAWRSCAPNHETLSKKRRPAQKLFFSATLSQDPEKLNEWGLFQPKLFSNDKRDDVARYTLPVELKENYVVCETEQKLAVLHELLRDYRKVLCFSNSAQAAHRLAVVIKHMLKDAVQVAEMSAALNRTARNSMLNAFRKGAVDILVSTDALARGIDIVECDCVISYDPPKTSKTYVHRVGRTGRAGNKGTAITLLTPNQLNPFKEIMKTITDSNADRIELDEAKLAEAAEIVKEAVSLSGRRAADESAGRIAKLKIAKRGIRRRRKNVQTNKSELNK